MAEAKPLLRRALRIFLHSLGQEHPNLLIVADNYLDLLQAMGNTPEKIQAEMLALTAESSSRVGEGTADLQTSSPSAPSDGYGRGRS